MSEWKTTLKSEELGRWEHRLLADLVFEDDEIGEVIAPSGMLTDFASIRSLHNVVLFILYALVAGYGNKSAAIHDLLYTEAKHDRKTCDQVLFRALRAEGIARWRAWLFYAGVRLGGGSHFGGK